MNISANTSALMALNELKRNSDRTQKIMTRAAMGEKIANAGDNAANYAISEKMRANIRALDQDIVNASTGNRLIATAESGIHEIVNNLRAIKELAINSANDTNTDADRAIMQKNVDHRLAQIDDIAATTNYNGKYLLNGDYRRLVLEKGTGTGSGAKAIKENDLTDLLSAFSGGTKTTGAAGSRMAYGCEADIFYKRTSDNKIKVDFSGAKKADGTSVTSADYPDAFDKQGFAMGCTACPMYVNVVFDASLSPSESTVDYAQERAQKALSSLAAREKPDGIIDKAIEYALGECTHLGAYYQELEFTQSNLTTQSENTTNAESVIRDADMGETMMEYTKLNILTQASQAMLGQANQNVGSKLDLLK